MTTNLVLIKQIGAGMVINQNLNKSAFVLTNKTLDSVFITDLNGTRLNDTILDQFRD